MPSKRGRESKHNAVPTSAEMTTANGMRGDIITANDGGVAIVGEGVVKVVGVADAARAYPVRAAILSLTSPAFTLSGSNNTLTANSNGALGTYLGLSYAMPVGSAVLVSVGGPGDGLWTVSTEGDGSTPAVLTRTLAYRTAASLPELVAWVSPTNGDVVTYALVGTPPTPGAGPLPYYRGDSQTYGYATAIAPTQVAAASLLVGAMRLPQVAAVSAATATNDGTLVLPYASTLLHAWGVLSASGGGGTVAELRSASGGGGISYATMPTGLLGGAVEGVTSPLTVPRVLPAGTYYLRRGDVAARGEFYFLFVRNS